MEANFTYCLDLISAGIVLVLAESSGADLSGITLDQQESSWKECLQTLDRMVDVHPSARDYYVALHDLRQSYTTRQAECKIFMFWFFLPYRLILPILIDQL